MVACTVVVVAGLPVAPVVVVRPCRCQHIAAVVVVVLVAAVVVVVPLALLTLVSLGCRDTFVGRIATVVLMFSFVEDTLCALGGYASSLVWFVSALCSDCRRLFDFVRTADLCVGSVVVVEPLPRSFWPCLIFVACRL